MTEQEKELESIAHWITLTWGDFENIADLVEQDFPKTAYEYDIMWQKWEKHYRLGAAVNYLRELKELIDKMTK